MPYKSDSQRRFFNSPAGKKKVGAKVVKEFNEASKGKSLPEKVSKTAPTMRPADVKAYQKRYPDA
jgi:hypothetical protein